MNHRLYLACLLLAFGCSTTPLTDEQKLVLQTREFPEADINDVFSHLKNSLNALRYSIKSADILDETIVASRPLPNSGGSRERREDIIINFFKLAKSVRVQISIQEVTHYSLGGSSGKELLVRDAYEKFFAKANEGRSDRVPASVKIKKK